jgi:sulfur carrier protein
VILTLNGEARELPDGATVAEVVALLGVAPDARGIAVAIEREVVPRGAWAATVLPDGATVEVVTAIQGG